MTLNILNHFLIHGSEFVLTKLLHNLVTSEKEYESENFGMVKVKVGLDHRHCESTEAFLDNPSERAIVWVLALLAVVAVTFISK